MGHCLSGIVDEDKAPQVAAHLMSPEMFSGWGVRTLASDMGAYNPASYHNGSVWPHDNAIIAAGLMRYGFVAEAQRIATGTAWMRQNTPTAGSRNCSAASAGPPRHSRSVPHRLLAPGVGSHRTHPDRVQPDAL